MAFSGTTPELNQIDANAALLEMQEQPRPVATDPRGVLVLLSGGQDSTTCLFWARAAFPASPVHALTVHYGQRHEAEVGAAAHIAGLAGCATHDIVDLVPVLGGASSALVNKNLDIEASGGYRDEAMPEGLPTSFVPGRNLVFLAVAAAYAARYRCQAIVTGVCQTDYSGYPDCRLDFVRAMAGAIRASLPTELHDIEVYTPLLNASKADTVRLMHGISQDDQAAWMALSMTVTCYQGRRPGCGRCPACLLRSKGFEEAGVPDPAGVPMTATPRRLDPVEGIRVPARGSSELSPAEARATPHKDPRDRFAGAVKGHDHTREAGSWGGPEAAAAEVDAFDRPEVVLRAERVAVGPEANVLIDVLVRGDAIELRGVQGGDFSLREAAEALDMAGLVGDAYRLSAVDFRSDIRPDRPRVHQLEVGTRTVELSEADLQALADASVLDQPPESATLADSISFEDLDDVKPTIELSRETVRPADTIEVDHSMGTGKSHACEVPQ